MRMYKPQYSDFTLPAIRAVKAEHRQWRREKIGWIGVLGLIVIGAVIVFSGFNSLI